MVIEPDRAFKRPLGAHMCPWMGVCVHTYSFSSSPLVSETTPPSFLEILSDNCFFCFLPGAVALSLMPTMHRQMSVSEASTWKTEHGLYLVIFSIIRKKNTRASIRRRKKRQSNLYVIKHNSSLWSLFFGRKFFSLHKNSMGNLNIVQKFSYNCYIPLI